MELGILNTPIYSSHFHPKLLSLDEILTGKTRLSREVITGAAIGATILVLFVFLGIAICGCLRLYRRKKVTRRPKKENQHNIIVDQSVTK